MRVTTAANRMSCFSLPKPSDITQEQWDLAKSHATITGNFLPQQTEDAAFYFYLLGDSWDDISARLNIPMGVVIYTCLMNKWHEKRKVLTKEASKNKLQRADQAAIDLLTDAIVATTAIYRSQIAQAMRDPEKAKECPFIPKNLKEIETLLKLFKSFDASNLPQQQNQPNIHLNIANMLGQQPRVQVDSAEEPIQLERPDEVRQDRLRVLELLKAVKEN